MRTGALGQGVEAKKDDGGLGSIISQEGFCRARFHKRAPQEEGRLRKLRRSYRTSPEESLLP